MKRLFLVALCMALMMGCITTEGMTPEQWVIHEAAQQQAKANLANIALDTLLALTADEGSIRDYIAENPREAAVLIGFARAAIETAVVAGIDPKIADGLRARFEIYVGEALVPLEE